MLCIFCLKEKPSSLEHIFPSAIGGTIITDRVCRDCNSILGSRVDAALSDALLIRLRRAKLGLAGNSGVVPHWSELFTGKVKLANSTGDRVQTTFDQVSGKLNHRLLYRANDFVTPEGKKVQQITLDIRDKDKIPTIIRRERKRRGLSPLRAEQLAAEANVFQINTIYTPVFQVTHEFATPFLRHALFKIAYELAFIWLGEGYLEDRASTELREAIVSSDETSTDWLPGAISFQADGISQLWHANEAHHLAYASIQENQVIIYLRIFDILSAAISVSNHAEMHFGNASDRSKLRFLVIDTVGKTSIDSEFDLEMLRIACVQAPPPYPDPIETIAAAS